MARTEDFQGGYGEVREPQFRSVQQQANRNFEALSVLDNLVPNQNGMGQADLQRKMVGSQNSPTGRSESTFDKQLWLRHQEPANRIKRLEGQ